MLLQLNLEQQGNFDFPRVVCIAILTFSSEVKVFSTMARYAAVAIKPFKAKAVAGSKVNGD